MIEKFPNVRKNKKKGNNAKLSAKKERLPHYYI